LEFGIFWGFGILEFGICGAAALCNLWIIMVWIKKKKVTQRAQRTTEIREAGKTLCVFKRTNNFLFKPFEQKETEITKKLFPPKP